MYDLIMIEKQRKEQEISEKSIAGSLNLNIEEYLLRKSGEIGFSLQEVRMLSRVLGIDLKDMFSYHHDYILTDMKTNQLLQMYSLMSLRGKRDNKKKLIEEILAERGESEMSHNL